MTEKSRKLAEDIIEVSSIFTSNMMVELLFEGLYANEASTYSYDELAEFLREKIHTGLRDMIDKNYIKLN